MDGIHLRFPLLILLLVILSLLPKLSTAEIWIGDYSSPNLSGYFSILMDIKIEGDQVNGVGISRDNSRATITGKIVDGHYELIVHPNKNGMSTEQDIRFRGKRDASAITGEWKHPFGIGGPWNATLSDKGFREAFLTFIKPMGQKI